MFRSLRMYAEVPEYLRLVRPTVQIHAGGDRARLASNACMVHHFRWLGAGGEGGGGAGQENGGGGGFRSISFALLPPSRRPRRLPGFLISELLCCRGRVLRPS